MSSPYDEINDSSDEDFSELRTLDLANPYELMCLVDDNIRLGRVAPYKWQKEFHLEVGKAVASDRHPWLYALVAGNGAGKDSFIISWLAVWFAVAKKQSRTIITSASVNQLNCQTEPYIKAAAMAINKFFERKSGQAQAMFRIQKHYIRCLASGSEIRLFATDDAGKAEGYHPMVPGAEMLMIVNEAKSVSEEIFTALHRCTGYSHWLEISSPGEPIGHFYESTKRHKKLVVDYTVCPHISEETRLRDKEIHGESSMYYRSCYLGLFTLVSEKTVVDMTSIEYCRKAKTPHLYAGQYYGGGDIGGGRDKNTITMFDGNKYLKTYQWVERDMSKTSQQFINILLKYPGAAIAMDNNAIGQPIVDIIRADPKIQAAGITIIGIRNQSKALDPANYGNRGAELWVKGGRMIETGHIICDFADNELVEQITKRRFTKADGTRMFLESKVDHPGPSPDLADSFMLALSRVPKVVPFTGEPPAEDPIELRRRLMFKQKNDIEDLDTREIYGKIYRSESSSWHPDQLQ